MFVSFALVFLFGLLAGFIFEKLHLPKLVGMLVVGMVLGPYALGMLDEKILLIAPELRQFALLLILTRAGLALDLEDLKRVGRPAVLLCFLPACFEMLGMVLLAPRLFGISVMEALILGAVVCAVSPAVIVPRMLHLMDQGYGTKQANPQMIMAGASVDDVFVIVVFTAAISVVGSGSASLTSILDVPVSIGLGIIAGIVIGWLFVHAFWKWHIRDTNKVILILGVSFCLVAMEQLAVPFSGYLAVMSLGIMINKKYPVLAKRLSVKYSKLWIAGEIMLFVLVGAAINFAYAWQAGLQAVLLILFALLFRIIGVWFCLIHSGLEAKEKLFCMVAYLPKATVQAAIGAIPLSMGLACGDLVLTIAVLAILITAPLGAWGIDMLYAKTLTKN